MIEGSGSVPLTNGSGQGFGSGSVSGSAWIRINLSCWIRIRIEIADPDPDPGGEKWSKKIEKRTEFSSFEVLDAHFWGLKAFPRAGHIALMNWANAHGSKAMSDLWFSERKKMSVERRANWQKKEFAHRSKRSLNLKERAFWEVRSLSDVTMAPVHPLPCT